VQPDTKTTRFKIKNVASTYLPEIEIGRRRRRLHSGDMNSATPEEIEQKRRERRKTRGRVEEEDEEMGKPLEPGQIVSTAQAPLTRSTRINWRLQTPCTISSRSASLNLVNL
jgi:hypothetical protein